jgi:hypothetical protein
LERPLVTRFEINHPHGETGNCATGLNDAAETAARVAKSDGISVCSRVKGALQKDATAAPGGAARSPGSGGVVTGSV